MPYSRYSRNAQTGLEHFSALVLFSICDFEMFQFPKILFLLFANGFINFLIRCEQLGRSKVKQNGFGTFDIGTSPGTHVESKGRIVAFWEAYLFLSFPFVSWKPFTGPSQKLSPKPHRSHSEICGAFCDGSRDGSVEDFHARERNLTYHQELFG